MGQWFFILTVCGGLYLGAKWISTRENSAAAPALSTSLDSSLSGDSPMAPLEPPGSPVNGKKRGKTSTVPVDSQATGNKTDSDGLPDSPSRKSLNAREPVPASPGSPPGAVNDSSPAGIASSLAVGNKVKVSIASLTTDHVKIKVISSTGDLIQNLYEGPWNPSRTVTWNGEDLAGQKVLAGDYFVVIQTATKTVSNKVSIKP
jgi:hypothetical protein